ncbi:glycosyltransferase family 61 protein [Clostridium sp. AF18-27]|nr:glycosyltransferase family 61 protein [Enterocloster lavalensis]RHR45536.1 glycosyltransferase family 61 protein [Clostridium sp. AF18-27]
MGSLLMSLSSMQRNLICVKKCLLRKRIAMRQYCPLQVMRVGRLGGGVLDCQGNYIEDSALKAESLMAKGYVVEKTSVTQTKVIYLGCFIKQWGHFLVDFVPRLWYLIDNKEDCNLVYVSMNGQKIDGVFADFLKLFGIDIARLVHVTEATRFQEVIVPQTSYQRPYFYCKEYGQIFQYIVGKLNAQSISFPKYEKIYWTRTKLKKAKQSEIGEKHLERFFEANGYKVLAPEKLSLLEQVYYFSTCKKMAGISGSIPHNLVFADSDTEMLILNRTYRINVNQFPINEMCGANVIYLDCHAAFLPNSADKGPYWLTFNSNMERYANDNQMIIPASVKKSQGRIGLLDFIKYTTAYFNTYSGKELQKIDAGMAGSITGRTRTKAEGLQEHEIYYYYRSQFGFVPSLSYAKLRIKIALHSVVRKSIFRK